MIKKILLIICIAAIPLFAGARKYELNFNLNANRLNALSRTYTQNSSIINEKIDMSSTVPGIGINITIPIFNKLRLILGYTQLLQTVSATNEIIVDGNINLSTSKEYSVGIGNLGVLYEVTSNWDIYLGQSISNLKDISDDEQLSGQGALYFGSKYEIYPDVSIYFDYNKIVVDKLPQYVTTPSFESDIISAGVLYTFTI